MATTESPDCTAFVDKWHAREPEMVFAESFCARVQRPRFRIWGALLLELREAAFELSDIRVIEAKSAWWAEELARSANLTARHPLTQALLRDTQAALPWRQLGKSLLASAACDLRPSDSVAALAGMRPLAEGIQTFEAALFADGSSPEPAWSDAATSAVIVHLLGERLRVGLWSEDGGRIPLSLLARHRINAAQLLESAGAAAIADWAQQLLVLAPGRLAGASVYRCTRLAFDRRLLQQLAGQRAAVPAGPMRALWMAWGAARGRFLPASLRRGQQPG